MSRFLCFVALVVTTTATIVAPPVSSPAGADGPAGTLLSPEDFVARQYEDFLGRSPDAGGLRYWSGLLRDGTPPATLVESVATSSEFEGSVAPVVRLYFAFFGRAPDYQGLSYWSGLVRGGVTIDQVAREFARSAEFTSSYGTLADGAYVDLVYRNVLGRTADAGGRAYWIDQLRSGLDRGRMMAAFSESPEHREVVDPRVRATMLYVGMLRRAPDAAGLAYWAAVIGSGTPYREVIGGFLDGAEYANRIDRLYPATHPLTGVAARSGPDRAALAVKIDNVDGARPQTGVDRADVVYEEMVEGQLTRLLAVFHSDVPDVVGPVRSVRTTDFDLLDPLGTPLLAASGANPGILALVDRADRAGRLVDVDAIEVGSAYFRSSAKRAPHNLFVRTSDLHQAAGDRGGRPVALFEYRRPGATPTGGRTSVGVDIDFGTTSVGFRWSAAAGGWRRTQNGSVHAMAGGANLAPENVVVLEVRYGPSAIDAESPEARTVGTGRAWVFTAGRMVDATWRREAATEPIRLIDGAGRPVALTRGQTFVELAPPGSVVPR